jgi:hypothetical protein
MLGGGPAAAGPQETVQRNGCAAQARSDPIAKICGSDLEVRDHSLYSQTKFSHPSLLSFVSPPSQVFVLRRSNYIISKSLDMQNKQGHNTLPNYII